MGELASDKNLNQGVALSSVDWRPAEGWHGFVRPDFSAMFIEGETACGKHMTEEALLSSSAAAVTLCCLELFSLPLSQAPSLALHLLHYSSLLDGFYCLSICPLCVIALCVCLVPKETRRRGQIPGNWS